MHVYHDNQHQKLPLEPYFQPDPTNIPPPESPQSHTESRYAKSLNSISSVPPHYFQNPTFSEIKQHITDKLTTPPSNSYIKSSYIKFVYIMIFSALTLL